jgi:hypothetical protein
MVDAEKVLKISMKNVALDMNIHVLTGEQHETPP